ncbi:MAG: flavodoxin domain-containing protein [Thermodesulfobacteriota bacterium]
MSGLTRREFMVAGSVLAGAAAVSQASGSGVLSVPRAQAADIDFPESSCGPKIKTGQRVLVAYASYCGTTGGVAEAVGQVLCDAGAAADVRLVKHVDEVTPYRAVVVGSAVRSASWLPEAIEFVRKHGVTLSRIPVAFFLTCLALYQDTEESRKVARSYLDPVLNAAPEVRPMDLGLFAGVLDYSKLNVVYRLAMKAKMQKKGVPEGDFRDWQAIRSWAGSVASRWSGLGTI